MPSKLLRSTVALGLLWVTPAPAETYTNRLIDSADPYLRMHAHNPVDWYPWGPAAFAKAKAENKPIFLSIGYSTCYWCHVAETTIYSNPAIAAVMNKWFVNMKVDREQLPDVDALYIDATEILTGHGAWPNNLFLTPDLKPFYAGSYFPPTDQGPDTPGFPKVLDAIHDLWEHHRADQVDPAANDVMAALRKIAAAQAEAGAAPVTPRIWLATAAQALAANVDPRNGGFGKPTSGPKFPQAPALGLLAADAKNLAAAQALRRSLDGMAYGGIHDQIGGGFHRYSTEPTWSVPHFEKMLADNAQLLKLYAQAYATTHDPLDRDVALGTAAYLLRDMADPQGGFYTAQDAAIDGVEGADYLWTQAQIEQALGADATRFLAAYALTPVPDAGHGPAPEGGVLRIRLPIEATLKAASVADVSALLATFADDRAKLLAVRRTRPQPMTDRKIVTGLNGLAIDALARTGLDLGAPDLVAAAAKAADRIWRDAYDPKAGLLRHTIFEGRAPVDGYLDDYAEFGNGVLTLAEATHDGVWRTRATALADSLTTRFLAPDGALRESQSGSDLPLVLGDQGDEDTPSGASATLRLLARLGAGPDGARYERAAAAAATRLAGRIAKHPTAWPSAVAALANHPLAPDALAAAAKAAAPAAETQVAAATPEPEIPAAPSTADHVHATATVVSDAGGDRVEVTLTIDPGFHVNAHVPSLDYLVPTDLAFMGLAPTSVDYPKPASFQPAFSKTPLAVYEGTATLAARFPKGALSGVMGVDATVTTQACDARTCLPPATVPVRIANPG